ncbi:zincin-like metallopeptidase toxin 4 of polymorphic toxin system [Flavobacterium endophyticum]|uniref:Zincin-like metallopeptidase toxin 4 of polymorphic toxin system n=1 Tax=Flavobacterium endophyticum TaxID=1540163 RepID=A0A495MLS1_9FLAO|nr:zincin-like metallopeptidase toxin domain-containing protein [Flavobacterium endophyticum]RKS26340.1 zincin-like metallopeptidase toxin 4 of polymorphic toxin system [Flavobacterium endophyticum]
MRATEYGLLHNGNYSYKDVKSNIYAFNNEISVANDETDEEEENAYTEIVYVEIEPYGEANPNEYKIVPDGEILDIREGNYLLNSNATSATEIAEPATIHFQNSSTTAQICKFDNTYFALITKSEIGAIEWNFLLENVEIQPISPLKKKKREKITLLNDILKEKQLSVILFISKDGAMLETAYQSIDDLYENEIVLFIETNDKKNLFGSVVRIKTGANVTTASGVPYKKLSKVVDYFNTHIHSASLLEIIQEHVEDKSSNFFIVKSAVWGIINKVIGFTSKLTLEGIEILSDGIAGLIGKLKLDDSQWQYYDEKGQPLKNPNLFLPGLGGIQYLEAMNKKGKPLDPEKTNALAINKIVYLENVLRNQKRDLGEAKFFKDIINQQLYVLARVKDFLSDPLDKTLELAEITFVMYNAFIVGLINSIIDAIKGIFDIITLICKGLIALREKGQNVAENPLSYISLFFEMIENMLETLANLFSKENLKALIEFFKKSGLFILTLPSKIFNWLAEGLQMPNLDKVAYYIGYIIGFIIQLVLEILFTGGAKTVADAFKKLADSLISIFKTMKSFVFKFKEGAVIAFENFLAIFAFFREKSKNLKILLDEVWEFIQTLFRRGNNIVDDIPSLTKSELDWMASRKIGNLGGNILKASQIRKLRGILKQKGIHLIVEGDLKNITKLFIPVDDFKTIDDLFYAMQAKGFPGGFNAKTKQFFLSKKATEIVSFHEMAHLKHFEEIGESYLTISRLEKETYVWEQIFANRNKWTKAELQDSLNYMNGIRIKSYNLEPLKIKI